MGFFSGNTDFDLGVLKIKNGLLKSIACVIKSSLGGLGNSDGEIKDTCWLLVCIESIEGLHLGAKMQALHRSCKRFGLAEGCL